MYIRVRATADAKKEGVWKESEGVYRIQVKEPRARNLANDRIRQLLVHEFGLSKGDVRMIKGHRSPTKFFEILKDKT